VMRLLADENFNGDILRGLRRRMPAIDALRIQEVGMRGASDEAVLAWAAAEGRVILTHDVSTLIDFAWQRVRAGQHHAGVAAILQQVAIGAVVADLVLFAECSTDGEWADQVIFLPF